MVPKFVETPGQWPPVTLTSWVQCITHHKVLRKWLRPFHHPKTKQNIKGLTQRERVRSSPPHVNTGGEVETEGRGGVKGPAPCFRGLPNSCKTYQTRDLLPGTRTRETRTRDREDRDDWREGRTYSVVKEDQRVSRSPSVSRCTCEWVAPAEGKRLGYDEYKCSINCFKRLVGCRK